MVQPLSDAKRGAPGEKTDLTPFWDECERCVDGLGVNVSIHCMDRAELV